MCFETLRQVGLRWFQVDDTGFNIVVTVMTVVAIVIQVLDCDDVVFAMM